MHRDDRADEASGKAVEELQQFGLRECEAKCFVALSALSTATADRLSDVAEVPRTRIYESVRVLEARGLVDVQRSTPQRFHAVSPDEATTILRNQYDARFERLTDALETVATLGAGGNSFGDLRTTTRPEAVGNRLVEDADEEVRLVLGDDCLLTDDLAAALRASTGDATVVVGGATESLREEVQAVVPEASTYVSELDWLFSDSSSDEAFAVGRLLLVDRSAGLISTLSSDRATERAVVSDGPHDGLVVFVRRLLSSERRPIPQP